MAAFLIPIGTSSLRGLGHILTCQEAAETPFTLAIPPPELGPPQILSSNRVTRADEGLCGGLVLEMAARIEGQHTIAMIVGITNDSEYQWKGTIQLQLGKTPIPVGIGEIEAGETREDTVEFDLDPGTHELEGSLLIGP